MTFTEWAQGYFITSVIIVCLMLGWNWLAKAVKS